MERKPVLLIDCDDTIENFCEVWIDKLNQKYNTDYTVSDITDWDISPMFQGCTKKELLSIVDSEDFWKSVKPKKGAQSAVLMLNQLFDVYLVTTGSYKNIYFKVDNVLKKYFWFINEDHIIACKDRHLIDADLIVDDNVNNIMRSNCNLKLLFTAPHNKKYTFPTVEENEYWGIIRVDNWNEALKLLLNWLKFTENVDFLL